MNPDLIEKHKLLMKEFDENYKPNGWRTNEYEEWKRRLVAFELEIYKEICKVSGME